MTPTPVDTDPRGRALRRMRALATGLLAAMAVVFVVASLAISRWPHLAPGWSIALAYVRAFAEAAMVGACADWFAVTALFRRPFGLPIPHTAIIPRNKDRIGQALGGFIADNFLSASVLDERLRRLELARWGGDWLRQPSNARTLARRTTAMAPDLLDLLPSGAVRDLLGSAVMAAGRAAPASPIAAKLLAAVWNEGRAEALLEALAARLGLYLAEHREVIQQKVAEQSYSWLPRWVDRIIADKITAGVLQLLADVQNPDHPWRAQIREAVDGFIDRLAHDPVLRERGERLKLRLLADPRLRAHAAEVWTDLEAKSRAALLERSDEVAGSLERAILAAGEWLHGEPGVQEELNRWARIVALRGLAPRRRHIGAFVAQVVSGWDTRSIVDKLELQVGADLQYIRVNGTIVGGLAGVAIYALSRTFQLGG